MNTIRIDLRLVAGVIAALALAGCGGEEEPAGAAGSGGAETTAGSSGTSGKGSADGKDAPDGTTKVALGEEATLTGLDGEFRVRVTEVVDPLPNPPTERPKAGKRFVGVKMALANESKKAYRDAPLNGSALVTDPAKAANPSILIGGSCTSKLGTKLRLPAGAEKKLCLPFQVAKKAKISAFQFRLNSGYGPETGEWAVK